MRLKGQNICVFDWTQRGLGGRSFAAKQPVRVWRNGRREGLKHPYLTVCRFESDHPHQITVI